MEAGLVRSEAFKFVQEVIAVPVREWGSGKFAYNGHEVSERANGK
jgi:hypothetical protein